MKKEDLINTLSNVNVDINSETALQAVELYVEFLYFEKFANFAIGGLFIALSGWIVYLMLTHD